MIIQFCGLTGSGKTTLANAVKNQLVEHEIPVEVVDGDEYRKLLCADFGGDIKNQMISSILFAISLYSL
ncbi:MAG: adenylyl-sulfate kinase [Bacteroidota bacterium]